MPRDCSRSTNRRWIGRRSTRVCSTSRAQITRPASGGKRLSTPRPTCRQSRSQPPPRCRSSKDLSPSLEAIRDRPHPMFPWSSPKKACTPGWKSRPPAVLLLEMTWHLKSQLPSRTPRLHRERSNRKVPVPRLPRLFPPCSKLRCQGWHQPGMTPHSSLRKPTSPSWPSRWPGPPSLHRHRKQLRPSASICPASGVVKDRSRLIPANLSVLLYRRHRPCLHRARMRCQPTRWSPSVVRSRARSVTRG